MRCKYNTCTAQEHVYYVFVNMHLYTCTRTCIYLHACQLVTMHTCILMHACVTLHTIGVQTIILLCEMHGHPLKSTMKLYICNKL